MNGERVEHLRRFYSSLDRLQHQLGGVRTLRDCSGRQPWPERGVYFFMESGETRENDPNSRRIVRVGTHALRPGSKASLWTRLSQHRGQAGSGGGNHRGSIFRLLVGTALAARHGYESPTWGVGSSADAQTRAKELRLELEVSKIVCGMPFTWLAIDDAVGPNSDRGYVERNAIGLLSNYGRTPIDSPSERWLGHHCTRERVRKSGLWNSNHVDEDYDPAFLDRLEWLVARANVLQ